MTQISLEVTIDQDICMGAAYCSRDVNGLFTTDAVGVVALADDTDDDTTTVPAHLEPSVRAAAANCPSGAISLREAIA